MGRALSPKGAVSDSSGRAPLHLFPFSIPPYLVHIQWLVQSKHLTSICQINVEKGKARLNMRRFLLLQNSGVKVNAWFFHSCGSHEPKTELAPSVDSRDDFRPLPLPEASHSLMTLLHLQEQYQRACHAELCFFILTFSSTYFA